MATKTNAMMKKFGLIGRNISYSFSKKFFTSFFEEQHLNCSYENFDIEQITEFPNVLSNNPNIKGLNVTIPYKEQIKTYLDEMDSEAAEIGAVNTIKISPEGKLKGYNTDCYGFMKSLEEQLGQLPESALVLGSGGASKAVVYALKKLGITYRIVSRKEEDGFLNYNQLSEALVRNHKLIINCTPLGTFPGITEFPEIPYSGIGAGHLLFDLIYNPEKTMFLQKGAARGAKIVNGEAMLRYQALKSWEIWNQ